MNTQADIRRRRKKLSKEIQRLRIRHVKERAAIQTKHKNEQLTLARAIQALRRECSHPNSVVTDYRGVKNIECPDCGLDSILIDSDRSSRRRYQLKKERDQSQQ